MEKNKKQQTASHWQIVLLSLWYCNPDKKCEDHQFLTVLFTLLHT